LQPIRVYIPYFTNIQVQINKLCREDYWTILHRRFMLRIGQKIAENRTLNQDRHYKAFITGESLAQVASQTIENIAVINKVSELPIIRPLIGFDKYEIIQLAEKIGTFRISKKPHEDCCTVFAPKRPHTKAREYDILQQEEKLDVDALIEESLEKMEIVTAGEQT
jgi:thiamine biosynthesis protein ThiI